MDGVARAFRRRFPAADIVRWVVRYLLASMRCLVSHALRVPNQYSRLPGWPLGNGRVPEATEAPFGLRL